MFNLPASPQNESANLDRLIEQYPGPALILTQKGSVLSFNEKAEFLLQPCKDKPLEDISDTLIGHVEKVLDTGLSHAWHIKCDKADGDECARSFMVSGIPFPAGKKACVLILCMETSAETAIRDALIESRAFYKDFSDFSCEFAWTTDENGRFSYVSEKGILGLGAQELYGMDPANLLASGQDPKVCEVVFNAQSPLTNMDIYLEYEGVRKCYRFSVEPVFDPLGIWQGARGIASDITLLKEREAELTTLKDVETRTREVVDAIRAEIRPEAMLETAVSSIIRSGAVDACWIFHRKVDTRFTAEDSPVIWAMTRQHKKQIEQITSDDMRKIVSSYLEDGKDVVRVIRKDNLVIHVLKASYADELYGVLCFVRVAKNGNQWSEADTHFSRTVADQTAISLALFEQHTRLEHLSRTDSLTGLLNRRAFSEESNRILYHHKRMKRSAVMIYIDLDNFKTINDTHGHKIGDKILSNISHLIQTNCRESDLAVRFGGDEFGIFMQEADETIALIKANDLIDGCQAIAKRVKEELQALTPKETGLDALTLKNQTDVGLSIGISVFDPYTPEDMDSLIHRADEALYDVKKTGKGGYRLARNLEPQKKNVTDTSGIKTQRRA